MTGQQNTPFFCFYSRFAVKFFEPLWPTSQELCLPLCFWGVDCMKVSAVFRRTVLQCSQLDCSGWVGWGRQSFSIGSKFCSAKEVCVVLHDKTAPLWDEMPLASLGRHQMYGGGKKNFFFLTLNCRDYSHHSKEIASHRADFPFGRATPPWLELAVSWHYPHQGSATRSEQKNFFSYSFFPFFQFCKKKKEKHGRWQRISFAFRGMINWYKRLKQWEELWNGFEKRPHRKSFVCSQPLLF